MAVIAVVSVWTPLGWPSVAERWFTLPNFYWFVPFPFWYWSLACGSGA
jgi:cytochrome d ubiquinol oxidase subunit II